MPDRKSNSDMCCENSGPRKGTALRVSPCYVITLSRNTSFLLLDIFLGQLQATNRRWQITHREVADELRVVAIAIRSLNVDAPELAFGRSIGTTRFLKEYARTDVVEPEHLFRGLCHDYFSYAVNETHRQLTPAPTWGRPSRLPEQL